MTNKGKKAAHLAQAATTAETEQQRQNDVIAAQVDNPVNQGAIDAADLTVRLLSSLSTDERSAEPQGSVPSELPSSSSGKAKVPAYSSRRQQEEQGGSQLPLQADPKIPVAAASAAIPTVNNSDFVAPDQELPAFVRSASASPKRKRCSTLTYQEYLAQQAPPPPPPRETRDDKRRKIASSARAAATAEKTKALLLAKGKIQPTDDDIIAALNKLYDFDKRQKLTSTQANHQAREQERLKKLPPLVHPRRRVDLATAEAHYGKEKLQEFFDRCTHCKSEHAPRGRSTADLPGDFFVKEYHHGKWVFNASSSKASWHPFFYPHGYFNGEDGRWIGNLTPDGKFIYRRDGTVGPEYSGSN